MAANGKITNGTIGRTPNVPVLVDVLIDTLYGCFSSCVVSSKGQNDPRGVMGYCVWRVFDVKPGIVCCVDFICSRKV